MSFLKEAGKYILGGGSIGAAFNLVKPLEKYSGIGMLREKAMEAKEQLPGQKNSYSSDGIFPEVKLGEKE